ncbi:hypothetical protein [Novosphingobium sp. PY1]|uniref:Uncharacterized protein n=1 Tax=Ochrobactrum sp. PW1 TaxID=1882222 RepID=A0A292GS17_9HYPH|nr:hypothetical protein [Novosphingobium sp. PY1]BBA74400.1 hypothetical protein [Ochrobactrum sp. PW1]GFM29249.1 uncharacterized protein PY1_contig-07-175 [Novosphingobium sp. PY1]
MDAVKRHIQEDRRRRYLPRQIEATRRKLALLEREAERYGMHELIEGAGQQ